MFVDNVLAEVYCLRASQFGWWYFDRFWFRQDSDESNVVVSQNCFVKRSEWLSCGWALLKQHADYPRDYLLPMPSGNYKGCVRRELRYDTAHALQTKVFQSLKVRGEPLLSPRTAQYWTPHSGRTAVGVSKPDRDMLGGWAAQQSDRYIRVSRSRIAHVQKQVVTALTNHEEPDPLCEEETLQDLSLRGDPCVGR